MNVLQAFICGLTDVMKREGLEIELLEPQEMDYVAEALIRIGVNPNAPWCETVQP